MATISLCMIVKNEGKILARCLDSIADLMDEIIIVDTGSSDSTKEIARRYTNKVYDYEWCDDFSAARNYSFSLATCDYIYAPDADEFIDEENHHRFSLLKEALMEEVEIVQMNYVETSNQSVLNTKKELRPKLFKRLRTFTWVDPIHETIRTTPIVFDSDVEIQHCPNGMHGKRDFSIFTHAYHKEHYLSSNIISMYAKELLKCGDMDDLADGAMVFEDMIVRGLSNEDNLKEISCVLARYYRLNNNTAGLLKIATKDMLTTPCSEVCYELGEFYYSIADYLESSLWFQNAAYETEAILDIHTQGDLCLSRLADTYTKLMELENDSSQKDYYTKIAAQTRIAAKSWFLPEE